MVDIMPAPPSNAPPARVRVSPVGLTAILVGSALAMGGPMLFDRFVKGLFIGAGVALVVLGAFVIGARWRTRPNGLWLPSRDDD